MTLTNYFQARTGRRGIIMRVVGVFGACSREAIQFAMGRSISN